MGTVTIDVEQSELSREAEQLLLDGAFAEALEKFTVACESGDTRGLLLLGYMHKFGLGTRIDTPFAFALMSKSAERSYAPAMCALATTLHQGKGVERNTDRAAELVLKSFFKTREAAMEGDWIAQFILGYTYSSGFMQPVNLVLAAECYEGAAKKGFVVGLYNLGVVHENGSGVEVDLDKAIALYKRAAEMGYHLAKCALGTMYEVGRGVEVSPSRALELYREAAEKGSPEAQTYMGTIYYDGNEEVEVDEAEALRWFTLAAEQGSALAQNKIAIMHFYGKGGVELSYSEAARYFRMAAESGNKFGQYNLGMCYENGQGVATDMAEALKWYEKSAAQSYGQALHTLGFAYLTGSGVEPDRDRAVEYLERAGEAGSMASWELLIRLFSTASDDKQRAYYLERGAESGSIESMRSLAALHESDDGVVDQDWEKARHWWKQLSKVCVEERKEEAVARHQLLYDRHAVRWSTRRHHRFSQGFRSLVKTFVDTFQCSVLQSRSGTSVPLSTISFELVLLIVQELSSSLFDVAALTDSQRVVSDESYHAADLLESGGTE